MQILALKIAEFFMYIAQYGTSKDIYHENLCLFLTSICRCISMALDTLLTW